MEILNFVFAVFIIGAPVGMGAYMVLFNRRFSLGMYRQRESLWKIPYSESDVKVGQVFVAIIGAGVLIIGLIVAAQLVL